MQYVPWALAKYFLFASSFLPRRLFVRSFILSWYSVLCASFLFLSNSFLFFSFPIVPSQISQSSIERARACSSSLTSILVFFCSSFFFYTSSFPGTFTWCVRVFHYNFQRSALMHIVCVCVPFYFIFPIQSLLWTGLLLLLLLVLCILGCHIYLSKIWRLFRYVLIPFYCYF